MTDKELWEKSQVWESSDDGRGKLKILESVEKFAELVRAAERNKLAAWMMQQGYATGHGDTVEDLLEEFKREASFDKAELWIKRINDAVLAEREACAKVVEGLFDDPNDFVLEFIVDAIRARGQA